MFLSLVITLSLIASSYTAEYEHTIFVHPNNGTEHPSCVISNHLSTSITCNSLSSAFNVSHRANSTQYVLSTGTHYLDESTPTFEGLSMISFIGSGYSYIDTVIHCTSNKAGLAFENVTDIMFSNITFFNCSAVRNSTSKNYFKGMSTTLFYVALYFYSCRNVGMHLIKVDSSPSATGVVMYNTDGANTITHCVFSNNSIDTNGQSLSGGGGFYVEFTYCIPGDIHCKDQQNNIISHTSRNTEASYIFNQCDFVNNNANTHQASPDNSTTFLVPYRADHVAFGRGGGLSIFVKGNASNNNFLIKNCTFLKNSALWGAGLFVEFHDDTLGNTVIVEGSDMKENRCFFTSESGTGGGGMRLGHYVYGNATHNENTTGNHITINNCMFENNSALNGGGLSISPTVQNVNQKQIATVVVNDTVFLYNYARLGAALHIDRFVMILDGLIVTVMIDKCTFQSNSVDFANYLRHWYNESIVAYQAGMGAMYVNQVPVQFLRSVSFLENNGSALAVVGTSLDFSDCYATFIGNMGYKGGAITLLGMAYIKINNQTNLVFIGNVATVEGGAIYNKYIERENLISYGNCFIRHTNYLLDPSGWEGTFFFYANSDQSGAHLNSIHTTSVLPCTWSGGSLVNEGVEKVFCWSKNWDYYPNNCSDHISSDVGNISLSYGDSQIEAFPGQMFNIPITIVDDLDHSMTHQVVFSASVNAYKNQSNPTVSYIWDQMANISGNSNTKVTLLLDGLGDKGWHIDLNVNLKNCPPGFKMDNKSSKCVCAGDYYGSMSCNHELSKAYLENNTWMGIIPNHTGYLVSVCPPQFCYYNSSTPLPNSTNALEDQICGHYNRKGILCGECKSGYAVAVNSPFYECVKCNDSVIGSNIAKYVAAVYIPLTAFFLTVIFLNIRLTSGPANAFILYSQLITTTFDLSADNQINIQVPAYRTLLMLYKIPYGIFDLQFFKDLIPDSQLCIGNVNALDVIALDYAIAVYPLIMIVVIVLFVKVKDFVTLKCSGTRRLWARYGARNVSSTQKFCRNWKVREAILPAFAAFLLLSYNKFSTTSSYLIGSQPLLSDDGQPYGEPRVYFAGYLSFYDSEYTGKYLPLASIVLATFVAIPPLLLLDFPLKAFEWCISKVDCLWRHYPADKVQILLDTFQGCYKNKMRFFSGLYFLFRLLINAIYLTTNTWLGQFFVQQMACVTMIVLLIICQPYNEENKIFNTVDTLIFLNLAILNSFSFYLYSLTLTNPPNTLVPERPFYFQYFFVYLPLVYMLGYVIWYLLRPKKLSIKRGLTLLKKSSLKWLKRNDYTPLNGVASDGNVEETEFAIGQDDLRKNIEDSQNEAYSDEEALLRRAESRNRYRTPATYSVVGINEDEDEAAVHTLSSNDSGVRSSVQSTPITNYGSTGSTTRSNSGTKRDSNSRPSVE